MSEDLVKEGNSSPSMPKIVKPNYGSDVLAGTGKRDSFYKKGGVYNSIFTTDSSAVDPTTAADRKEQYLKH
jgi:hypothetical protein